MFNPATLVSAAMYDRIFPVQGGPVPRRGLQKARSLSEPRFDETL